MKTKIILISILFFLIIWGNLSFATILEKLDTKQLTERSNLIVIGKVDKIFCEYDEEMKMIFTTIYIINENFPRCQSPDWQRHCAQNSVLGRFFMCSPLSLVDYTSSVINIFI